MSPNLLAALNRINLDFYERVGAKFWNNQWNYAWEGWEKLDLFGGDKAEEFKYHPNPAGHPSRGELPFRVLDLGCGNGRFLPFIYEKLDIKNSGIKLEYIGVDFGEEYLNLARKLWNEFQVKKLNTILKAESGEIKTPPDKGVGGYTPKVEFINLDLLNLPNFDYTLPFEKRSDNVSPWGQLRRQQGCLVEDSLNQQNNTKKKFDLIALFGVFHHIPGRENRLNLIKKASEMLKPNGQIIFTLWRFQHELSLTKRILKLEAPESQEILASFGLDKANLGFELSAQLEPNDYILDWNKKTTALRYAHDFDEAEINELLTAGNLKITQRFLCDGRSSRKNEYFVCRF